MKYMGVLIIASNNKNKINECKEILGKELFENILGQQETNITIKPIESGKSFEENALIKARAIYTELKKQGKKTLVLADDSGLCVEALNGEPNTLSARYAAKNDEENASDKANRAKLIKNLKELKLKESKAAFVCCVAMVGDINNNVLNDKKRGYKNSAQDYIELCTRGECEGKVIAKERGTDGFGYDSMFIPKGHKKTFAESISTKYTLSHRKKALESLKILLTNNKNAKVDDLVSKSGVKKTLSTLMRHSALMYGFIGVINTIVCWAVILGLTFFRIMPELANACGYVVGFLNSYILNKKITFKSKNSHAKDFIRFGWAMGIAYLVNLGVLVVCYRWLSINEYISQIVSGVCYTAVGYMISRFWAFKQD